MTTLDTEEGGGLYRVRRPPPALSNAGFKVHLRWALLITSLIKRHDDHKDYLIADRLPRSDLRSPGGRVVGLLVE